MRIISDHRKYGNSEIKALILEYIHDARDRKMLYWRLVDGMTIGDIAAKLELNDKTVWKHLQEGEAELFSHLPG